LGTGSHNNRPCLSDQDNGTGDAQVGSEKRITAGFRGERLDRNYVDTRRCQSPGQFQGIQEIIAAQNDALDGFVLNQFEDPGNGGLAIVNPVRKAAGRGKGITEAAYRIRSCPLVAR
jgi:hypothetical protein